MVSLSGVNRRPQLRIVAPAASPEEAAAVVGRRGRFGAPPGGPRAPPRPPAALAAGSARRATRPPATRPAGPGALRRPRWLTARGNPSGGPRTAGCELCHTLRFTPRALA